ncbi:hypothetical protein [Mycolicibacterium conceptionense]
MAGAPAELLAVTYVTPRVVEFAYTFHSRGVGYAADHMWSNKNFAK